LAKIIAITNQKGGVGKTTTCAGLCGGLVSLGYKVLAIDLDPQGNLSFSLGVEVEDNYTVYDVMKGNCDIGDAIVNGGVCDIVPSNILLSGLELEMTGVGREYVLREQIGYIKKNYDYIVLDTPPALSVLTINAYTASDELVIPMPCEVLALQGIAQLRQTIFAVKRYYNKSLAVRGILLNRYNPRLALTKEVEDLAQMIADQLETKIFETKISTSVAIAEAPAHGESIITYSPNSRSAKEFMDFVNEVISPDLSSSSASSSNKNSSRKKKSAEGIKADE